MYTTPGSMVGAALGELVLVCPSPFWFVPVADGAEAPPVIVVVSWPEAVGRKAETVTVSPRVAEADSYDALEKPQVLIIELTSVW